MEYVEESRVHVFLMCGFLESGKTEFITYTIAQPYFRVKGKTLIIACEEGEIEYDPVLLKKTNSVVEWIEDEEDFTEDNEEFTDSADEDADDEELDEIDPDDDME